MKKEKWTIALTVVKYVITALLGWLGGNGIESML